MKNDPRQPLDLPAIRQHAAHLQAHWPGGWIEPAIVLRMLDRLEAFDGILQNTVNLVVEGDAREAALKDRNDDLHRVNADPIERRRALSTRLGHADRLIEFIRHAIPVLWTMLRVAGLKQGAAKADEMIRAIADYDKTRTEYPATGE